MINLAKIGSVKVRGWNRKLRFDDENTDFLKWAVSNQKTKITVIVSKDEVGDYFIVFKIPKCLKPFPVATSGRVGIDVGVKDIAVLSSGQKYENRKYKKKEKRHQKLLNRKMSRRWGPANEEYRAARKKNGLARKAFFDAPIPNQKPPSQIHPSHGYMKARMQHAKLNRKIARKREFYNHVISRDIVEKNGFIAVETLTITNMVRNKRLAYALTDAAFGNLLSFIRYKAKWHKRIVQSVNKWTPSSKRCSNCGYIYNSHDDYGMKPWSLSIRNWTCPCCKTRHDRDINAAKNILYYVENQTFQAKPTT